MSAHAYIHCANTRFSDRNRVWLKFTGASCKRSMPSTCDFIGKSASNPYMTSSVPPCTTSKPTKWRQSPPPTSTANGHLLPGFHHDLALAYIFQPSQHDVIENDAAEVSGFKINEFQLQRFARYIDKRVNHRLQAVAPVAVSAPDYVTIGQ